MSSKHKQFGLFTRRRDFLLGSVTAIAFGSARKTYAHIIGRELPWAPNAGNPPSQVVPGPWVFFTADEGRAIEALADCIIPPDHEVPGGKASGSAIFIDRQLAGAYGRQDGLYIQPPFMKGTKSQGPQSPGGPITQYREGLAALDKACQERFGGKRFADLAVPDQNAVLDGLDSGAFKLTGADGRAFFNVVIKDVQMGFFADPIYGGNIDMVSWKMIGFPGARYNYLDWVDRHNERFPLPPVGMTGRAEWNSKRN